MTPSRVSNQASRFSKAFGLGLIATGVAALSVHVVLQQVLHVPYPQVSDVPIWAKLLRPAGEIGAVIAFWRLADARLSRHNALLRVLTVALLYAMVKQVLRGGFMTGVVTTAWTFSALKLVPVAVTFLIMTALTLLASRFASRGWKIVIAALLLALVQAFALDPVIHATIGKLVASYAYLDHDEVYGMPYGMHVLIPAYLSYVEPTLGVLGVCVLTWQRIGQTFAARFWLFMLLIELMAGEVIPPAVWTFFSPFHAGAAFMSTAQFSLEYAVLSAGVALCWYAFQPRT